ncbi:MAG: NAD(P)-dependent oxidoreductase [Nanoarchaeota archaeon]
MKIVLVEPIGISQDKLARLIGDYEKLGHTVVTYGDRPTEDKTLIERCLDADIMVVSNLPVSEEVINQCNNLKMISVAFTGVDHIPLALCKEKGIVVCNAAGYSTDSVAELAIGLMISVLRKIAWGDNQTKKLLDKQGFLGTELKGKTLGIIGTGAIGLRVSELGKAFGCNVIAYSRTKKNILGVSFVELDELLSKSDIVSIHTPLNESTKSLINKDKLELMKSAAILINTARGPIVNNDALADVLIDNKIAGAGIDVFDTEPPLSENYKLLSAPNTVLTPHVAYATKEALGIRAKIVFDNIRKYLENNPQNKIC